jgi:hypothetical protein
MDLIGRLFSSCCWSTAVVYRNSSLPQGTLCPKSIEFWPTLIFAHYHSLKPFKRMRFIFLPACLVIFSVNLVSGQDTLPKFSAVLKANGKVVISWHNNYQGWTRSASKDRVIAWGILLRSDVPDPTIPENGFVDSKTPSTKCSTVYLLLTTKYSFSKSAGHLEAIAPV